jgi:2'-5' RNA ligase
VVSKGVPESTPSRLRLLDAVIEVLELAGGDVAPCGGAGCRRRTHDLAYLVEREAHLAEQEDRPDECDRGFVVSALPRPSIVGLQDVELLVVTQGRLTPGAPVLHVMSLAGLDLIPHGWLHLTVQGVGMVADVPTAQRDAIVAAVRTELAALRPPVVTFHEPVVRPEAIALPPAPVEQVQQLRAAIRTGMAAVRGDAVPESPSGFQPHVSIAYVSEDQPAAPVIRALGQAPAVEPVTTTLTTVSLIEMHRDRRMYEWQTVAAAAIGTYRPYAAGFGSRGSSRAASGTLVPGQPDARLPGSVRSHGAPALGRREAARGAGREGAVALTKSGVEIDVVAVGVAHGRDPMSPWRVERLMGAA